MAAGGAVFMITEAPMGSGKTLRRCAHYLVYEFLPEKEGVHYSNFPVLHDGMEALMKKKHRKLMEKHPELVHERVKVIPPDVIKSWSDDELCTGPWDYFSAEDGDGKPSLAGAHLALDEAHIFAPCVGRPSRARCRKWREFLGEVRHRGATVEFITQDVKSIDEDVARLSAVRLSLINQADERDQLFGIAFFDWYQLKGKFTGEWRPTIIEKESRKEGQRMMPYVVKEIRRCQMEPALFTVYDSYSKPHAGGETVGAPVYEFERRSWPSLLLWFFRRNWWRMAPKFAVGAFVFWLAFLGGFQLIFPWVMDQIQQEVLKQMEVSTASASTGTGEDTDQGEEIVGVLVEAPEWLGFNPGLEPGTVIYRLDVGQDGKNELYEVMASDFVELLNEQEQLERALESVKRDLAARPLVVDGELSGITKNGAWFGMEFAERGKVIRSGEYAGKVLTEVFPGRGYVLIDGGVVRVRRSKGKGGGAGFPGVGVARSEPSGPGVGSGTPALSPGGPENLYLGGGSAN
jgi:hypothetical protein